MLCSWLACIIQTKITTVASYNLYKMRKNIKNWLKIQLAISTKSVDRYGDLFSTADLATYLLHARHRTHSQDKIPAKNIVYNF